MSEDRPFLDAFPDAVVVHDAEGDIVDVNQAAAEHLGYPHDELVDMTIWELAEDPDRAAVTDRWRSLEPGEVATFDGQHVRFDGATVPVRVHVGRVYTGDEPRYLATVRDVSEQVARERELEQQNERLETFTSFLTHDLRNPLNVVKGRLELAMETGDTEHLEAASRATARMEELITDLLELAQARETDTQREPVALAELVEECWTTVETADADLVNGTDRVLLANPGRVRRLLENLVRNAVVHGGGDVTVRVGDLDGGFYVADDGPGIPPEERDRVLEAGYTTDDDGTGFGLAIVATVAEAHGWDVRLTDAESGGARFEFTGVEEPARQATEHP